MIVCKKCGNHNLDDDEFCGSCGAFLEWEGERVEQASEAPKVEPVAVVAEPPGLLDRVKASVGLTSATADEPPDAGADVASLTAVPSNGSPDPPVEPPTAKTIDLNATPAGPVEGQVATPPTPSPPMRLPEAEPDQPAARAPTRTKARPEPKKIKAATATAGPNDVFCGHCGMPNAPERRFCRSCGGSLATATPAKVSWWRRLFARKNTASLGTDGTVVKGRGVRPIGRDAAKSARVARSKVMTVVGKGSRILGLLAVAGVAVGGIGPWREPLVERGQAIFQSVRQWVAPNFEPVAPFTETASTALRNHPAANLADGSPDTFWAENAPGDGVGQTLRFTFERKVDIDKIGFKSGRAQGFRSNPRPRTVQLLWSDGTGERISLRDTSDFQDFGTDAGKVKSVRIRILKVFGSSKGDDLSISEIEFFERT